MKRLARTLCCVSMLPLGAWAPRPVIPTIGAALPVSAETPLARSFPCVGRLIDAQPGERVLLILDGFDDGTVPAGQNGELNDRGVLLGLAAVSNLRSDKLRATVPANSDAARNALGKPGVVSLVGSFTAYDQRTQEKQKSLDAYLPFVQGTASRDYSYSALQFTGVLMNNGMPLAGGGFRYKAVLNNVGARFNVSVFKGDSDIGATLARSSFQARGDIEALVIDLSILETVSRIFGIDASSCLNTPGGVDYAATSEALFSRLSRVEQEDRTIAALFRLGYLPHPTTDYSDSVTKALRRFQSAYGLPPDGLPNSATFAALGRAAMDGEARPGGVDVIDSQLGQALEAGRTGATITWSSGEAQGWVSIGRTWENYEKLGRPCRAFTHQVQAGGRRLAQPETIACRLDANVWAVLH